MTGKLPTNYLGSPLVTDSLPFQLKSAGICSFIHINFFFFKKKQISPRLNILQIITDRLIYIKKGIPMWYYGTKMPAFDVLQNGNFFNQHVLEYPNNIKSYIMKRV